MTKWLVKGLLTLIVLVFLSTSGFCQKGFTEKPWISGQVKGNVKGQVITLELVDLNGNFRAETSLNRYGWYAFSTMERGNPSNYKLIVYAGNSRVKEMNLGGVKKGGRVPVIVIK